MLFDIYIVLSKIEIVNIKISKYETIYIMKNKFANNLKLLRSQAQLSQKELASKIKIGYKTISHWESGYAEPSMDMLMQLKEIFNVSYEDLIE